MRAAAWRKSSYSGGGGGGSDGCVEVIDDIPGMVPVRDSKSPHRTRLTFPAPSWAAFVARAAREGALSATV
ncbi:DUF397 domain-containing protein [Streptomyces caatingaensis]|uniref:DUF397 domain-containing protein n=1 Tax=Streptomyces caatingaensis TaxID=1678637 RepID=A0A0K9XBT1_9ACTN|nr:DUF397 domain-containing protein [Streptomyces caatingaensis]KNB50112.1 hypothetical protein AC230_25780 [Streptomyces caatingaensis]